MSVKPEMSKMMAKHRAAGAVADVSGGRGGSLMDVPARRNPHQAKAWTCC
jgi:hypothetical protein